MHAIIVTDDNVSHVGLYVSRVNSDKN